jgi:hypothetical protein
MLTVERRRDGSLLLSSLAARRWGVASAGLVAGLGLLAGVALGEASVLASAVVLPLGLITLLAGVAVARHRDWILFDRPARQVVFRRGLASIFRPVSVFEFDDVDAVRVEALGETAVAIGLVRSADLEWPIASSTDPAYTARLVDALHDVGGWPVHQIGESATVK